MKGEGNSYDFGARMYDSRIGRWLSKDPLESKYVSFSPFVAMVNNPIAFYDPNGEEVLFGIYDKETGKTTIYALNANDVAADHQEMFNQLKAAYDYVKTSQNEESLAIATELEDADQKFLFRANGPARRGFAQEVVIDDEFYFAADVNLAYGKILRGPPNGQAYGEVSPAVGLMAHELGHLFELHFTWNGLENSPVYESITVRGVEVEVLPFVSVIRDGKEFHFIRPEDFPNTSSSQLASYGLIRLNNPIEPYVKMFGGDKVFTNQLVNKYGNWYEYIGMYIQNLFADGLVGESEEKTYHRNNYYSDEVEVDNSTDLPSKKE